MSEVDWKSSNGIVTDSIKDKLQGNSSILFVVSPTYLYILECLLPINCKPFKTISSKLSGFIVTPYNILAREYTEFILFNFIII